MNETEDKEGVERAAADIRRLCDDALSNRKIHVIVLVTNGDTGKNDILMINGNVDIAAYITERSAQLLKAIQGDLAVPEGVVVH